MHEAPEVLKVTEGAQSALPGWHVFRAFESLEASRIATEAQGTELALSKWLVRLMQADMGVASKPGRGSRFRVRLARMPETGFLRALQAQPELVLLDIQRFGQDGYQILRPLRRADGASRMQGVGSA